MGAIILSKSISKAITAGDHGTTFGGGPLVSTVALAVMDVLGDPSFLQEVLAKGDHLGARLKDMAAGGSDLVTDVRGRGLFLGCGVVVGRDCGR